MSFLTDVRTSKCDQEDDECILHLECRYSEAGDYSKSGQTISLTGPRGMPYNSKEMENVPIRRSQPCMRLWMIGWFSSGSSVGKVGVAGEVAWLVPQA